MMVFLTMGFFRLSFDAFKSFFSGLIVSDLSTPKARISVEKGSEDLLSLVVLLEQPSFFLPNAVDPQDLSIRVSAESVGTIISPDAQRVNGYPFFQAFIKAGEGVKIEYLHRTNGEENVYDTKIIDSLQIMKAEPPTLVTLKGSALDKQPKQVPLTLFQWMAVGGLVVIGGMYSALRIAKGRPYF